MRLDNHTILLGVSGGIAAYKSASLASSLVQAGADVRVIMTENAQNFINPITFETLTGHKCITDTFDRDFEFSTAHVELAKAADLILVAPATADVIARLANGLADDMLTTTILASTARKLIAPAMNTAMYQNPATQENLEKLTRYGMEVIPPDTGYLACGDTGPGRMCEPEMLYEYCLRELAREKDLSGTHVLVSAGPTQEALDPVRFLTNHSSGKMGYCLAKEAMLRGADVTLVTGPTSLTPPPFVNVVNVTSAQEMADAVKAVSDAMDLILMAAAVADFSPEKTSGEKIKKTGKKWTLPLAPTEDILAALGAQKKPGQFLCGFSMETEDLLARSRDKLKKKHLDMIVANNLKEDGAGFAGDTNVITLLTGEDTLSLPKMTKEDAAKSILDEIQARR